MRPEDPVLHHQEVVHDDVVHRLIGVMPAAVTNKPSGSCLVRELVTERGMILFSGARLDISTPEHDSS